MVLPTQRLEGSVAVDSLKTKRLYLAGTEVTADMFPGVMKIALISGGVAGNHTVIGIATGDHLVSVLQIDISTGDVVDIDDLSSEFTITASNTINNTGGTDTTGDKLLVVYQDRT